MFVSFGMPATLVLAGTQTITNNAVTNVTTSGATISGTVTDDAIAVGTSVVISSQYSLTSDFMSGNGPLGTQNVTASVPKNVTFTKIFTGLAAGTHYFYKTEYRLSSDPATMIRATATGNFTTVQVAATGQCADSQDNDNDTHPDQSDPNCHSDGNITNNGSYTPTANEDGTVPITVNPTQSQVYNGANTIPGNCSAECSDGVDNNGDNKADALDPKCHTDGDATNADSYNPTSTNGESLYCLLEPIPIDNNGGTYKKINSGTSLSAYINTIFKICIGIIGVLAVIMIIVGGVQYMSTDAIGGKEDGKETISKAFAGLFIGLASYLILYTINPQLVSLNFGVVPVTVTSIQNYELPPQSQTVTIPVGGSNQTFDTPCPQSPTVVVMQGYTTVITPVTAGMAWPSDSLERGNLPSGVTVNANNCANVGNTGCTSLSSFPSQANTMLTTIKNQCGNNCELVITGGTECWLHASHGPGLSVFDLRENAQTPNLTSWVKTGNPYTCINWIPGEALGGCASGQAALYVKAGLKFIDEENHFHVKQ